MYRITQEAVHNAVKHGQPESIVIDLKGSDDAITLRITDDGRGISSEILNGGGYRRISAKRGKMSFSRFSRSGTADVY